MLSIEEKKEKTTFCSKHLKPWVSVLTKTEKISGKHNIKWSYASINAWSLNYAVAPFAFKPYIYYACSKLILFNTHNNCLGCMEIVPIHCGAGSVKVNYYRCMRKIWGLVKPHKVNKLQMRLSYCRIYFNTVCNMKKHKQAYTNKAFTSKNRFQEPFQDTHSVIFVVF